MSNDNIDAVAEGQSDIQVEIIRNGAEDMALFRVEGETRDNQIE
ncbi:hypothetical protein [Corynebacterium cystitidis]|nr:hypothetical protein [Corynebacterium cystitidis]